MSDEEDIKEIKAEALDTPDQIDQLVHAINTGDSREIALTIGAIANSDIPTIGDAQTAGEQLVAQDIQTQLIISDRQNGDLLSKDKVSEIVGEKILEAQNSSIAVIKKSYANLLSRKDAIVAVINEQYEAAKTYKQNFDFIMDVHERCYGKRLDIKRQAVLHTLEAALIFKGALPSLSSKTRHLAERFWTRRMGREGEKCLDEVIRNSAYGEFTTERKMGKTWGQIMDKLHDKVPESDQISKKSLQIALSLESARSIWDKRSELGVKETDNLINLPVTYFHRLEDGHEYPILLETKKGEKLDVLDIAHQLDAIKTKEQWQVYARSLSPDSMSYLRDCGYDTTDLKNKGEIFNKIAGKGGIIISTDSDGDISPEEHHNNLNDTKSSFINFNKNTFHIRLSFDEQSNISYVSQRNFHRHLDGKAAQAVGQEFSNKLAAVACDYISGDISEYRDKPKFSDLFQVSKDQSADFWVKYESHRKYNIDNLNQEMNSEVLFSEEQTSDILRRISKLKETKNIKVSAASLLPYANLLLFSKLASRAPVSQFVIDGKYGLQVTTASMPAHRIGVPGSEVYDFFHRYLNGSALTDDEKKFVGNVLNGGFDLEQRDRKGPDPENKQNAESRVTAASFFFSII